jgi:hypothetical protein
MPVSGCRRMNTHRLQIDISRRPIYNLSYHKASVNEPLCYRAFHLNLGSLASDPKFKPLDETLRWPGMNVYRLEGESVSYT